MSIIDKKHVVGWRRAQRQPPKGNHSSSSLSALSLSTLGLSSFTRRMKRKKKHCLINLFDGDHLRNDNIMLDGPRIAMITLLIIVINVPLITCAPNCEAELEHCTRLFRPKLRLDPAATLPAADNHPIPGSGPGLRELLPSELKSKSIGRPPPRSSNRNPADTAERCATLNAYGECIKPLLKPCKTDLNIVSTRSLIMKLKQLEGCSHGRQRNLIPGTPTHGSLGRTISAELPDGRHLNVDKFSSLFGGGIPLLSNEDTEDDSSDEETKERLARCKAATGFHDQSDAKTINIPAIPGFEPVNGLTTADRSPPLICLAYGDPHLRSFSHEYQTCKCNGAWPLVDHPLFAVQVTNSPLSSKFTSQPFKIYQYQL